MNAIALQIPGHEHDEFIIAKDQSEYAPLPAVAITTTQGMAILTRWRPTDQERAEITSGADIWLTILTFGMPLQPIGIGVECPIDAEPV